MSQNAIASIWFQFRLIGLQDVVYVVAVYNGRYPIEVRPRVNNLQIMNEPTIEQLGVVQVPLSHLVFVEDAGERLYYHDHTDHLEKLFRGTLVDHSSQRNWIDGYIDTSEARFVLRGLGISISQLRAANQSNCHPLLENHLVSYTQGRHRIEAAKCIEASAIWTVRLFHTKLAALRSDQTVQRRTEQYQHERPYSDGQIYSKLREHSGNSFDYCEWVERLSKTKQKALEHIDRRLAISGALDKLINYPAVIDALQLSSWLKYFDWRLDDELCAGLSDIDKFLSDHTFGSRIVQKCLDSQTMATIEGRAPAISDADHHCIHTAFESRELFRGVHDSKQREEIESRIMKAGRMISGLKSLQSNMLYLSIAADIIWFYLIPKDLRKEAKAKQMSLRSVMRACWSGSVACVEIAEGEFQPIAGPPSFDMAYTMVMLAALRQFPYLSDYKPRADYGEKLHFLRDVNCVSLFYRRARLLGFYTSDIEQGVRVPAAPFAPSMCTNSAGSTPVAKLLSKMSYRMGRPHASIFRIIQIKGFLPCIFNKHPGNEINVEFLLSNLLQTFFNPCIFECDLSKPRITINVYQNFTENRLDKANITTNGNATTDNDTIMLSRHMDVDPVPPSSVSSFACDSPGSDTTMYDEESGALDSLPNNPSLNLDSLKRGRPKGLEANTKHARETWIYPCGTEHLVSVEQANDLQSLDETLCNSSTSSRSVLPNAVQPELKQVSERQGSRNQSYLSSVYHPLSDQPRSLIPCSTQSQFLHASAGACRRERNRAHSGNEISTVPGSPSTESSRSVLTSPLFKRSVVPKPPSIPNTLMKGSSHRSPRGSSVRSYSSSHYTGPKSVDMALSWEGSGDDRNYSLPERSQVASGLPAGRVPFHVAHSPSCSTHSRSTLPSVPSFNRLSPNWQGFIDSDDDLESISL